MNKIITEFLLGIFIFIFVMGFAHPALAHGGEPRLEINVERINPGGTVDVRGVEFDYEQTVALYLERTGIVVQLGEAVTDPEGVFLHIVVVPADLPQGVYYVRAVTSHHDVLSPALTVQGSPILEEGGGQGERDEDDGLLAPMPTYAPGVVPGSAPQQETNQPLSQETPIPNKDYIVPGLLVLLLTGALIGFGLRTMKKR